MPFTNARISFVAAFLLLFLTPAANADTCSHGVFGRGRAAPVVAPDREFDLVHVAVDLAIDPEKQEISGSARNRLTPILSPLSQVRFDFEGLTVDDIQILKPSDSIGEPSRKVGASSLPFDRRGRDLTIDMGRTVAVGETIDIVVRYHGTPARGLHFVGPTPEYPARPLEAWSQGETEETHFWVATADNPNDKATSEARYTVPAGFTAVGNGRLVSQTQDAGGHNVFQYRMKEAHAPYLISTCVGRYRKDSDTWNGKPVEFYTRDVPEATVKNAFGNTVDMIGFFSDYFGYAFPYDKYAQTCVAEFTWGGMENISATTLTERTLYDETARLDRRSDGLVAHELGHQWFGDLVTTRTWADTWLNEGFATWCDLLYERHKFGEEEYTADLRESCESYRNEDRDKYRRPVVTRAYEAPQAMFDSHSYRKGALVLDMLEDLLGEDGMRKGIALYLNRHAFQSVETDQFRTALEDATGRSLTWFFDQWIFSGGYPEFKVSWKWDALSHVVRVTVDQTQCVDDLTPVFRVPVEIALLPKGDGDAGLIRGTSQRFWIEKPHEELLLPAADRPQAVVFDPRCRLLKSLEMSRPADEAAFVLKSAGWIDARCRAAEDLGTKEPVDALNPLAAALWSDPSYVVQQWAAKSLGKLRTPAARDTLIRAMASHPESRVRQNIAKGLASFEEDERAAAALAKALREDRSYYAAAEAATALGKVHAAGVVEALTTGLSRDSFDETIRRGVFDGVAECRDPAALPVAMEWAAVGRPNRVREIAVRSIGKVGFWAETRTRLKLLSLLGQAARDPDYTIRRGAAWALGELGEPGGRSVLREIIDRDTDYRAVAEAYLGLEKIAKLDAARSGGLEANLEEMRKNQNAIEDRLGRLEEKLEGH